MGAEGRDPSGRTIVEIGQHAPDRRPLREVASDHSEHRYEILGEHAAGWCDGILPTLSRGPEGHIDRPVLVGRFVPKLK